MGIVPRTGDTVNIFDALALIEGTGEELHDVDTGGKERPWRQHKADARKLADLYELAREFDASAITAGRLSDLRQCADTLLFARDAQGKKQLAGGNFCHVRFCPMCNWRRSLKLAIQMGQAAALINSERKVRYIFVTLTCRNVPPVRLSGQIDALNKAWGRIFKTRQGLKSPAAARLRSQVLGYMRALEITYNKEAGNYHPHLHALLAVKPTYFMGGKGGGYIKQSSWVTLWQEALGVSYAPSVNVQAVKRDQQHKAIAEVSKYPVKTYDFDKLTKRRAARVLAVMTHATRSRRLLTFGGIIREARQRLKQDIEGDLIHVGDEAQPVFLPVCRVVYRWRDGAGQYIC